MHNAISKMRYGTKARSLAAVVLATVGLGASVAPASAANDSWISSNSGGANLRTCASTGCGNNPYVPYLSNGQHIQMLCYYDYQNAFGNYWSPRWFMVGLPYSNHYGWVHSSLVANQIGVGRCSGPGGWG
jgi:hypothetical protein